MYIENLYHLGPDNLSIRGLTESDLQTLRCVLRVADLSCPRENMQRLLKEIETYLGAST